MAVHYTEAYDNESPHARAAWHKLCHEVFEAAASGVSIKANGAPSSDWPRRPEPPPAPKAEGAMTFFDGYSPTQPIQVRHLDAFATGMGHATRDIVKPLREKLRAAEARLDMLEQAVRMLDGRRP
jgi:hypothetical protein